MPALHCEDENQENETSRKQISSAARKKSSIFKGKPAEHAVPPPDTPEVNGGRPPDWMTGRRKATKGFGYSSVCMCVYAYGGLRLQSGLQ